MIQILVTVLNIPIINSSENVGQYKYPMKEATNDTLVLATYKVLQWR